jgi:hypothetical protein
MLKCFLELAVALLCGSGVHLAVLERALPDEVGLDEFGKRDTPGCVSADTLGVESGPSRFSRSDALHDVRHDSPRLPQRSLVFTQLRPLLG